MKISMMAAMDENRLIGSGTGIPWHLPRDSEHFREYTADKAMLLGRRTFEEMGGWFTTQFPIIVTHDIGYRTAEGSPAGYAVVTSVEAGIEHARRTGEPELVVAGGAQIYQLALPFADELVLTEVHGNFEGSAYFPEFAGVDWEEVGRDAFAADGENGHAMSFVTYRRRRI